ncbi:unnamed protein product, partial [Rotaria sp. Silwood2]
MRTRLVPGIGYSNLAIDSAVTILGKHTIDNLELDISNGLDKRIIAISLPFNLLKSSCGCSSNLAILARIFGGEEVSTYSWGWI